MTWFFRIYSAIFINLKYEKTSLWVSENQHRFNVGLDHSTVMSN
ncbi:MAG: hypothetical protein OFPI_09250 [Osedax symbiont Rs2]|nr:MAG: hypothetical protein OFPI_09250 [Osedax symbiont Rs2]